MKRFKVFFKLIGRIVTHKFWVAFYCFQIGLYWQGLVHDLSKFSLTEIIGGIKYWDNKKSSLANERELLGYSRTFLHHRGRNPHHYEYWIHSLDKGGIPAPIPRKYALELICDYLAACRTYKGNPKKEYNWWIDNYNNIKMAASTKVFITMILCEFRNHSLKKSVEITDNNIYYDYT